MNSSLLRLAPEFGGTAFGPFGAGQTVAIGSDPQCHIVVPAHMGAGPVHARFTTMADGKRVLQAVDQRLQLYVHGPGQPALLNGQAWLSPGMAFSLGHPQGVRFFVEGAAAVATGGPAPGGPSPRAPGLGGRRAPTAGAMANEVKRQAGVSLMTGPLGQLSHTLFRAQSGALFQPRYIVAAVIGLGGLLVTTCGGLLAAATQFL